MQVKEMVYDLAFILCGIIFMYIIPLDSYLGLYFKTRGFDSYVIYFVIDLAAEFIILLIVTIYLKRNGFFLSFS